MFTVQVHDDEGKIALGGPKEGQSVEKLREYTYDTLGEAIKHYEQVTDWGLAGWHRVVRILDTNSEVVATKTHTTPRGVPLG